MRRVVRRRSRWLLTWVIVAVATGCADDGIDRSLPFGQPTPEDGVVAIRAVGCRRVATRSVGVVVAPGLVATVAHSVAGERQVDVLLGDGRTQTASVAAIDTVHDLAVLAVPGLRRAPIATGKPVAGPAEFVTSPEGVAVSDTVEVARRVTVRTSDIYRDGTFERPGLELSGASVEPGDSGGGLFQSGRLVAIVWATSRIEGGRAWATDIDAYEPLVEAASSGEVAGVVACGR